jgi:lipoprotein-releasing system permease protein
MASYSHASLATSAEFRIQQDFDDHYVITNLAFVKQMMGLGPDEYGGVELAVSDPARVAEVQQVHPAIAGEGSIRCRPGTNRIKSLYSVMGTEKWVIYILLTLILVVAAFNMVGALTMLVWDKQKDIHVLKALGARQWADPKDLPQRRDAAGHDGRPDRDWPGCIDLCPSVEIQTNSAGRRVLPAGLLSR